MGVVYMKAKVISIDEKDNTSLDKAHSDAKKMIKDKQKIKKLVKKEKICKYTVKKYRQFRLLNPLFRLFYSKYTLCLNLNKNIDKNTC